MNFDSVAEAVADIRRGRMVVVVDDESRENEGDVIFAAIKSTPAKINFLAKHARGLICVALTEERVEELALPPMVEDNSAPHGTAFTVSVEAREGTSTGISAADRSLTTRALADGKCGPRDFIRPGHVFPLRARRGGVLVRAGHTEAAVDLVKLAGLGFAGVVCEIMNEDGSMARLPDCRRFAKRHGLKIIAVQDLIEYRRQREKLVRRLSEAPFSTRHGEFSLHVYEDIIHGRKHLALVRGGVDSRKTVKVRVHTECLPGDVFGALSCDCGALLTGALDYLGREGGVFLYMRQGGGESDPLHRLLESRPAEKAEKPSLHHASRMDARTFGIGAQILFDLGIRRIEVLTQNPRRIQGLEGYGLKVMRQAPFLGKRPAAAKHKGPTALKGRSAPKENYGNR